MSKILEVINLSVLIKDRFLVKNVSFSLEQGQCLAIVGEDRSGKTSVIKAITGSLPVTEGQIYFDGNDETKNTAHLKNVGVCLDPPVFFKYQSVYENLTYLTRFNDKLSKSDIVEALRKVGLAHKAKTKVLFLSYYEKKLMSLALAFLFQPKLLLLDEPFKNLPEDYCKMIKNHLKTLQLSGTSILISTQNLELVEDIAEKFILMENRQIREILDNKECENYLSDKNFAFVQVKYPNYVGKIVFEKFDLRVKLLGNKVLFDADEDQTAKIVKHLTLNKIPIFKAGFLNKKTEQIFANLTPYFKEGE
ncbi:MAG: ABC transporter ATP-binding protein [Clostridiales bacterium]|nr:ABC transporter ATP-binding protein [Clostridiales bacterium]